MSMRDLVQEEAELDEEENDDSFNEETGEPVSSKAHHNRELDDSSEEEDDEDEEAARAVREGFIIDDDEEELDQRERRRRKEKKRRRAEREEEEAALDEEDLDLIGEANPDYQRKAISAQPKLKRLKRGHRDSGEERRERGLDEIFSDDEELDGPPLNGNRFSRSDHHRVDEFADFIEEDDLEDEDERQRHQEEMEVARPRERNYIAGTEANGLDKDALDDMEAIFGNGEDYDWALALEDEDEARESGDQTLELKDVFEPSQLSEKLLTDEDNSIRWTDEPERFQLDRMPYKHVTISEDQFKEENRWITSLIWPKKQLPSDLQAPFTKAVSKVLEFFVVDEVEVPYVFQHRKDYLIHATKTLVRGNSNPEQDEFQVNAQKLLNQDDLWRILELDLKFRALVEKRNAINKTYENLKSRAGIEDKAVEDMIPAAATMEELQDIQDYIYFEYALELKEFTSSHGDSHDKRRPSIKPSIFDRIRKDKAYRLVRAYGITPNQVAQNALREGRKQYTEDASETPIEVADSLLNESEFSTSEQILLAARQMYAEELFTSPRMRKHYRMSYYMMGVVNCHRTEKGLRKIDEQHPYYELKYLQNQTFSDIANKPEIFLKMLKAEEEGLIEVRVTLQHEREFKKQLFAEFASDNFSELADAWNDERQKVLDLAFVKLERVITKGVKESMRTECQDSILKICREEYSKKLDQAPYQPPGMTLGTVPRVLALSNGNGDPGRDAVCWAWVEEDGRVVENGKIDDIFRNERDRQKFVDLIQRRKPDVVGVSGFSAETNKLANTLRDIISEKGLRAAEYEDGEAEDESSKPLEVLIINDEVARLFKDSPRAISAHPSLPPLTRYCVALAKYVQNPMKEYAALGKDIVSLSFHPCQQLLPEEKLRKHLDTAMVDMVNLCGVDINEAISDSYTATLLPYICGLGPRKASAVLKTINANGGVVNTRDELVGDLDQHKLPVVGPRVWNNCASFLMIVYDNSNPISDYLDNTRVHPEDYELGRKMAADALELDEEDVKAEVDEGGPGAIVRKLIKEDEQDKVNDLILEEYAEQLERNYNQRKRATLETIRAELLQPYEELRKDFAILKSEEVFTMLTGETKESLHEGMVVPINIRIAKEDFIIAKLDSGLEGKVDALEGSDTGMPLNRLFSVGQTTQAKILEIDRLNFTVRLSLREDALRMPLQRRIDRVNGTWDFAQEKKDKEELREKDKATGRTRRVVKHPLFKPFNSTQAEEYLGSQTPGDVVIRSSSKGNDHLAVTWKVADGVYQHIDVLELQKENEFSVGRQLKIGRKYTYSDLDELIVDHVKAMAKKVDEMKTHEKYQGGSKAETEKWLTTYTEANPKRSVYAFCLDPRHPGYFFLCFKAGQAARVNAWPVRIVPNAFELMKSPYPDMKALCNGFKLRHMSEMSKRG